MEKPETPGYAVEVEKVSANSAGSSPEKIEEKIERTALMAMGDIASGEKFLKNVQLVILLLRVAKIILVQHYIMLLEEKSVQ